jgi:hypothetical protein
MISIPAKEHLFIYFPSLAPDIGCPSGPTLALFPADPGESHICSVSKRE